MEQLLAFLVGSVSTLVLIGLIKYIISVKININLQDRVEELEEIEARPSTQAPSLKAGGGGSKTPTAFAPPPLEIYSLARFQLNIK